MSARATRPRSRRGRHLPPGELDPVAESSEEAEAASGGSKPSPGLPQGSLGSELMGPLTGLSGQGLGNRTARDTDEDLGGGLATAAEPPLLPALETSHAPEAVPQDGETVPAGTGAPDVFQTLQHALSSLEAAVAAWRHQPPSCLRPVEAEGRKGGGPGPCGEQEGVGGCQQEAARLVEKNDWLRLALRSREDELVRTQVSLRDTQAEKETLQREVQELQDSLMRLEFSPPPSHSQAGGAGSDSSRSGADGEPWGSQDSALAHPLLRRLQSDSSTQILGCLSTQSPAPEIHMMESQLEQLQGSIEKLKCFNRLLLAVLQGYKGRCESLSMQLGQREAEATALRLALQYSEDCDEAYEVLLALREANSRAADGASKGDLQAAEKEACRLLAEKEGAVDQGTPWPSPEGSSVDKPTPQEVASQLHGYIQRLRERRALVKIPPEPGPTTAPRLTVPHSKAMVQAILEIQPGPSLPQLEKRQIQQDLVATREALTDLMLRLQLVRREKRGLELREAALRAQGPAHALLLEQLRWERAQLGAGGGDGSSGDSSGGASSEDEERAQVGAEPGAVAPPLIPALGRPRREDGEFPASPGLARPCLSLARSRLQGSPGLLSGTSGIDGGQVGRVGDPEKLSQELAASLTRALDLREQLRSLRQRLEQVAQKGRARCAQSAELNRDLCKAHSDLIVAFLGAHRKQEEQRRRLEQRVVLMGSRQAVELAMLEAAAAGVLGEPEPPHAPPQLGETCL